MRAAGLRREHRHAVHRGASCPANKAGPTQGWWPTRATPHKQHSTSQHCRQQPRHTLTCRNAWGAEWHPDSNCCVLLLTTPQTDTLPGWLRTQLPLALTSCPTAPPPPAAPGGQLVVLASSRCAVPAETPAAAAPGGDGPGTSGTGASADRTPASRVAAAAAATRGGLTHIFVRSENTHTLPGCLQCLQPEFHAWCRTTPSCKTAWLGLLRTRAALTHLGPCCRCCLGQRLRTCRRLCLQGHPPLHRGPKCWWWWRVPGEH